MSTDGKLFLFFIVLFFILIIIPSFVISWVRGNQECDDNVDESESGFVKFILALVMYSTFTLIVFIFARWNKDYIFGAILGEAVAYTTYTVMYVLTILFVSKIISLYIKPKVRVICTELYVYTFIASGLIMHDVGQGKNGFIYQKVKSYTEHTNKPRANITPQKRKPVAIPAEPIKKYDVDKGLNKSNKSSNNKKPSECVFKGVMTDADYLACGITPPSMKYKKLDKSINIKDLNKPYN